MNSPGLEARLGPTAEKRLVVIGGIWPLISDCTVACWNLGEDISLRRIVLGIDTVWESRMEDVSLRDLPTESKPARAFECH